MQDYFQTLYVLIYTLYQYCSERVNRLMIELKKLILILLNRRIRC